MQIQGSSMPGPVSTCCQQLSRNVQALRSDCAAAWLLGCTCVADYCEHRDPPGQACTLEVGLTSGHCVTAVWVHVLQVTALSGYLYKFSKDERRIKLQEALTQFAPPR